MFIFSNITDTPKLSVKNSKNKRAIDNQQKIEVSPAAYWNSIESYFVFGGSPTKQYSSYNDLLVPNLFDLPLLRI